MTGVDLRIPISAELERLDVDYNIYPDVEFARLTFLNPGGYTEAAFGDARCFTK